MVTNAKITFSRDRAVAVKMPSDGIVEEWFGIHDKGQHKGAYLHIIKNTETGAYEQREIAKSDLGELHGTNGEVLGLEQILGQREETAKTILFVNNININYRQL